jgi:hypothetical protein
VTIGSLRHYEIFSFLIVVFLFVKESYVWRTWVLFGISANALRAIFYSIIFDHPEATTVYFVGQDRDVAVPAVFAAFLLLFYVSMEVISRRAKIQAIESHKQALVPSHPRRCPNHTFQTFPCMPFTAWARQVPFFKTRWTSVIDCNTDAPAASNDLNNPHFNHLAKILEKKFQQVNDFPLDDHGRLKPSHMRVPPIVQSIQNVGIVTQRRCFVSASLFFCRCYPLNQFYTLNRKYCASLTSATCAARPAVRARRVHQRPLPAVGSRLVSQA